MSVSDFGFFGRLHPLVLHAPIGFLLAALVLEAMTARAKLARPALALFLWLTALSAVVAASTGWVLGHEDGYGGATLERHEQLGIAVALAASATARRRRGPLPRRGPPGGVRGARAGPPPPRSCTRRARASGSGRTGWGS